MKSKLQKNKYFFYYNNSDSVFGSDQVVWSEKISYNKNNENNQ